MMCLEQLLAEGGRIIITWDVFRTKFLENISLMM